MEPESSSCVPWLHHPFADKTGVHALRIFYYHALKSNSYVDSIAEMTRQTSGSELCTLINIEAKTKEHFFSKHVYLYIHIYTYMYIYCICIYNVYVYIMYRHIFKYVYRHDHEFLLNAWFVCTHSKGITKCFWCWSIPTRHTIATVSECIHTCPCSLHSSKLTS